MMLKKSIFGTQATIRVASDGLHFIFGKKDKLVNWNQLVGVISEKQEAGGMRKALLNGAFIHPYGVGTTALVAANYLLHAKYPLVFQYKLDPSDQFQQEIAFETSKNRKIRTAVMEIRQEIFSTTAASAAVATSA